MQTTIKAIETHYNGYRFRSRLEARWAVFFDALGIKYQYEPQGFDMDGVRYLPDFWLPDMGYWVEIKGVTAGPDERAKLALLVLRTKTPGVIYSGGFDSEMRSDAYGFFTWRSHFKIVNERAARGNITVRESHESLMDWSIVYDKSGIVRPAPIDGCLWFFQRDENNDTFGLLPVMTIDNVTDEVAAAIRAARQARFEHGEHGRG